MSDFIVLDLFACEGGASAGYAQAGATVYAVDLDANRLKRNPARHKLVADALEVLRRLARGEAIIFDSGYALTAAMVGLVHMSPPCQGYTRGNAGKVTDWPLLIGECRELAQALDVPYVIENVEDAEWDMRNPTTLCGCMFDLNTIDTDGIRIHLRRPRLFETNWSLAAPRPCSHEGQEWVAGAYGGARRDKYEARYVRKGGYVPPDKDVVKALLGIEHDMTWRGLFESIPPAYAEHIGRAAQDIASSNREEAA